MKNKIHKTNAARHLDELNISYELIPYEVDEENLSALHVAQTLGQNIDQVYKTLVLRGDKTGFFVCVIPGGAELDMKEAKKRFPIPAYIRHLPEQHICIVWSALFPNW